MHAGENCAKVARPDCKRGVNRGTHVLHSSCTTPRGRGRESARDGREQRNLVVDSSLSSYPPWETKKITSAPSSRTRGDLSQSHQIRYLLTHQFTRNSSANRSYNFKHSGFRSVDGLMLVAGAPLMICPASSAGSIIQDTPPTRLLHRYFHPFPVQCVRHVVHLNNLARSRIGRSA